MVGYEKMEENQLNTAAIKPRGPLRNDKAEPTTIMKSDGDIAASLSASISTEMDTIGKRAGGKAHVEAEISVGSHNTENKNKCDELDDIGEPSPKIIILIKKGGVDSSPTKSTHASDVDKLIDNNKNNKKIFPRATADN